MTDQIERVLGQAPQVRRSFEGTDRLYDWERRVLSLPGATRVYAREIRLAVGGDEVLWARSLAALNGPAASMLRTLYSEPLAQVLFTDERWTRCGSPVGLSTGWGTQRLVGRACRWQQVTHPRAWLLVEEYFLPPLLQTTGPNGIAS